MDIFSRSIALLGEDAFTRLTQQRIILFGVGGVGSWCAEALVRTGVRHLTLVDNDVVVPSNLNRQLMATRLTLGHQKVEAMRERLLSINPEADITVRPEPYTAQTAQSFQLEEYDVIIDAIDSLAEKAHLILHATSTHAHFFSAMGAALKLDPTRVQVSEFWQVKGCPLARALRNRFKREKTFPSHKFKCVWSDEVMQPHADKRESNTSSSTPPPVGIGEAQGAWDGKKAQINGSLIPVVATWGMTLASLTIKALCEAESQR